MPALFWFRGPFSLHTGCLVSSASVHLRSRSARLINTGIERKSDQKHGLQPLPPSVFAKVQHWRPFHFSQFRISVPAPSSGLHNKDHISHNTVNPQSKNFQNVSAKIKREKWFTFCALAAISDTMHCKVPARSSAAATLSSAMFKTSSCCCSACVASCIFQFRTDQKLRGKGGREGGSKKRLGARERRKGGEGGKGRSDRLGESAHERV